MQRRYQKISEDSGVDDNGWMSLSASYNDHFYRSVQEEEICTVMSPACPVRLHFLVRKGKLSRSNLRVTCAPAPRRRKSGFYCTSNLRKSPLYVLVQDRSTCTRFSLPLIALHVSCRFPTWKAFPPVAVLTVMIRVRL